MASILLGRFPGQIQTISIEKGATVGSVLQRRGVKILPGQAIFVSGIKVDLGHPLGDGDKVLLVRPIRGEVTARVNGNVWRMHQNDPDTVFPSDFHAHNQRAPEVVNLYDGSVYDARTRNLIRRMRARELRQVLEKLGCNS
jgi:hypothetical protein